ncbi:MAG: PadR family transcriptional regulator [Candidatus Acidiferrales bacterium]
MRYTMTGRVQLEHLDGLALELRRGAVVLAVLSQLGDEQYGYSLKKMIATSGLEIDEGTLYPLLRRLESQGLLTSRWRVEDGRPRRYYKISTQGEKTLRALTEEWRVLSDSIGRLLR